MKVIIKSLSNGGHLADIPEVSKAMEIRKLKKKIAEATKIDPKLQVLFFGGKVLNDNCDLCDYKIEDGYVIKLQERKPLEELEKNEKEKEKPKKESIKEAKVEENGNDDANGNEDGELSREEQARRLREIGCDDLANELAESTEAPPDEPCKKCKDNEKRKCKECGCMECGGKESPDTQLFCEECQYVIHMHCLDPPLETIPEGDFYCPYCKNDASEIVGKGEMVKYSKSRAKMPSRQMKCKRDWGKGMATAGRTKTNTNVPKNHYGPIPGIEVGMSWEYRILCSEVGVHAPPVAGIAAQSNNGCQSLVLAGGYEDDDDFGHEFTYTGSGGRDLSGNKRTSEQAFDQTLTKSNKGIALSCAAAFNDKEGAEAKDWKKGKPVRVLRSYKFKKHSKFAPDMGVRYDGIYKVVKYYPEKGKAGFLVWKFLLRRDDPAPAPWEPGAKKYSCVLKDAAEKSGEKRKAEDDENFNTKKSKTEDLDENYVYEPELLELIKKDTKNKKVWDDLIADKARKDKWFEKVQETFQCFACYEMTLVPITLPCNHAACKKCLKKSMKEGFKECWMCRGKIEEDLEEYHNKELEDCLKFLFPAFYSS